MWGKKNQRANFLELNLHIFWVIKGEVEISANLMHPSIPPSLAFNTYANTFALKKSDIAFISSHQLMFWLLVSFGGVCQLWLAFSS